MKIMLFFIFVFGLTSQTIAADRSFEFTYQKRKREFDQTIAKKALQLNATGKNMALSDEQLTRYIVMSTSGDGHLGNILIENVHGDVTIAALRSLLSEECLNFLVEENVIQDSGDAFAVKTNHFDNNLICESNLALRERLSRIPLEKKKNEQLHLFGEVLHAIRDFYSHSNYVQAYLLKHNNDQPDAVNLFDLELFCKKPGNYKDIGEVFTGSYEGNHGLFDSKLTDEDLANPRSHLHWNKDFSPYSNKGFAKEYSRASLLRSNNGHGQYYFDYVSSLQVRASKKLFQEVAAKVIGLDNTCKLKY